MKKNFWGATRNSYVNGSTSISTYLCVDNLPEKHFYKIRQFRMEMRKFWNFNFVKTMPHHEFDNWQWIWKNIISQRQTGWKKNMDATCYWSFYSCSGFNDFQYLSRCVAVVAIGMRIRLEMCTKKTLPHANWTNGMVLAPVAVWNLNAAHECTFLLASVFESEICCLFMSDVLVRCACTGDGNVCR